MTTKSELLHRYAEEGDEGAFAELVRRYLGLVYGTALRLAHGNAMMAQDVTQAVFTDLAGKASKLRGHTSLAGWLHTSARYAAAKSIRAEQSRRAHEQEAATMTNPTTTLDISWAQLGPLIDEAVGQLPERDRTAVLLRFFADKNHREVGDALGLNENAARMRVERALEKLRAFFARHGVTTTAALLATTLGTQAANVPVPEGLAEMVAGKSLTAAASAASMKAAGGQTLLTKAHWAMLAGLTAVAAGAAVLMTNGSGKAQPVHTKAAVVAGARVISNPEIAPANAKPVLSVAATVALAASAPVASASAATTQGASTTVTQNVPTTADNASNSTGQEASVSETSKAETTTAFVTASAAASVVTGIANWGPSDRRKLGTGAHFTGGFSAKPVLTDTSGVLEGKTIIAIASGSNFNRAGYWKLALCSDGTVAAWGNDGWYDGVKGTSPGGGAYFLNAPIQVSLPGDDKDKIITGIATDGLTCYVLCSDGTLFAWGGNAGSITSDEGFPPDTLDIRSGDAPPSAHVNPLQVTLDPIRARKVTAIAIGGAFNLALCSDGALVFWGEHPTTRMNNRGVLSHKTITTIATSNRHSLVLCSDGTLAEWGEVPKSSIPVPVAVDTSGVLRGKTITALAACDTGSLVLCSDGTLASWGQGPALGNTMSSSDVPVLVDTSGVLKGKTPIAITNNVGDNSVGDVGFLVLCSDGTLAAWGSGETGQLGNGQSGRGLASSVPVRVNTSGVLKGKRILAIAPGAVLFEEPAVQ